MNTRDYMEGNGFMLSFEERVSLFAECICLYADNNMIALNQWLQSDFDSLPQAVRVVCYDQFISFYLTIAYRFGAMRQDPESAILVMGHVGDSIQSNLPQYPGPLKSFSSEHSKALMVGIRMQGIADNLQIFGRKWGHFALVERPSSERRHKVLLGIQQGFAMKGMSADGIRIITELTERHYRNISKIWQLLPESLSGPVTDEPLETQLWCFAKSVSSLLNMQDNTMLMYAIVDGFASVAEHYLKMLRCLFGE